MTFRIIKRPAKAYVSADLETQRMAEIGRLSASLIHEISNPLSSVLIQLEQHKDNASVNLRSALSSVKTLRRYVDAARQQIKSESNEVIFSVNSQLNEVKRVVTPIAKSSNVKLKFTVLNTAKMYGDPVRFQQIVANILLNAIQAYSDTSTSVSHGTNLHASTSVSSSDNQIVSITCYSCKRHLHLKIQDWGKGIESNNLPLIFSNFYSTKAQASQGLGMGLFIVREHVCGYFKGTITVKSTRRLGTQFFIKLPLKIKQT